ncbi:deoxyuridine 5'-triphosphate nucleotidohydrolase [Candidatus Micrarchaeota archaeon]|nr:deoxyuridine 5'-triphosphate nucleotidohydrolase [Candidatus Micrarchaeota archaeon]
MILPKQHILYSKLFENMVGDSQYQPAGVDITLKEVYEFESAGKIDFDNSERKISEVKPLSYNSDEVHLNPGSYKVIFNEYVKIPGHLVGLCLPRSSLLRCGVTLETAVWDPGYEGRSEALLIVSNPKGLVLKRNAKIGQMIFVKLAEKTDSLYEGKYKGENKD